MTALSARETAIPDRILSGSAEQLVPRGSQDLVLQLWRPTSTSVVVHIAGELDTNTAPGLYELLAPRLSSTIETLVLDLSGLRFMGVAGLELVAHVRQRADHRAMRVWIVDGPPCVERALRAAGWSGTIPTYATLAAAVAELTPACEGPVRVVS